MAGESGPWQTRVSFAPDGSFAYRPGEFIVRHVERQAARGILTELAKQQGLSQSKGGPFKRIHAKSSFSLVSGVPHPLEAIRKLNQSGIYAQPNHVLFAHTQPGAAGDGLQANPFYANPFYANPFYANPFYANPFYANPFYANPFYANPFYANPNPAAHLSFRETGRRPSSARPIGEPKPKKNTVASASVVVLDTGYAIEAKAPANKPVALSNVDHVDIPDHEEKGYLDPVAGHGTFIAGIIEENAPGCSIEVLKVLTSFGDGKESEVAEKLHTLAINQEQTRRALLVNLSFGGYSSTGMGAIAEAIAKLHHTGATVVASAGNDGVALPMYPAVLPHVLAVGALDHEGYPAPFTNHGPWVRACALGVEVISTFFNKVEKRHPSQADVDIDNFHGGAVWSGTSFAAPRVLAMLAEHMESKGVSSQKAVQELIDEPGLNRIPMLGAVIN